MTSVKATHLLPCKTGEGKSFMCTFYWFNLL